MKRRSFFGFAAGAAVAGPGVVKQAAAQGLADLRIPVGVARSVVGDDSPGMDEAVGPIGGVERARARLDKFNMLVKSKEWLERRKRQMGVHELDPDLHSARSLSLNAKMRIQRDRNFDRWLQEQPSWLERRIRGEDDYF